MSFIFRPTFFVKKETKERAMGGVTSIGPGLICTRSHDCTCACICTNKSMKVFTALATGPSTRFHVNKTHHDQATATTTTRGAPVVVSASRIRSEACNRRHATQHTSHLFLERSPVYYSLLFIIYYFKFISFVVVFVDILNEVV